MNTVLGKYSNCGKGEGVSFGWGGRLVVDGSRSGATREYV